MRTDAKIDKRLVCCFKATPTGFGKWKAQVGDIIRWEDNDNNMFIGRMIGRIHYAPAIEPQEKPTRDWILVIALSQDLTFAMERWVNPCDVIEVFDPSREGCNMAKLLDFFLSDNFKTHSIDKLREWSGTGFANMTDHRNYLQSRMAKAV